MTTVYLIRHCAYESPAPVLPVRLPGFHLSDAGKTEAMKLAKLFSRKYISAVYSSPLERTRETAEIIAERLHKRVQIDDRLLEIRSPTQGKSMNISESLQGWNIYKNDWYKKNGGESQEEIISRMNDFLQEKIKEHEGKEFIVVSHGDPIMLLISKLQDKNPQKVPYVQMGEVVTLRFEGKHLALADS